MGTPSTSNGSLSARQAEQLEFFARWCLDARGRTQAARQLRRVHLPADPTHVDDLCSDVFTRLHRHLLHREIAAEHGEDSLASFGTSAMVNAANDLIRRGSAGRLEVLLDPGPGGALDDLGADESVDIDPEEYGFRAFTDAVRTRVHLFLGERARRLQAWTVGAALVAVTLADDPDLELLPSIPVPEYQGLVAGSGSRWAGLAYAGRTDCFAEPDTGPVRERRSLALQRVDRTLREAIRSVGEGPRS